MKKMIFNGFAFGVALGMATSVFAQQFVDCSDGNADCDVLYSSEEMFVGNMQQPGLLKTNDRPLAESEPIKVLPSGNGNSYNVVLPKGATVTSSAAGYADPGAVAVPNQTKKSRVDLLPDGSVQTTTIEVTTEATPDGYQETTRRIERLDTEKKGAVWVEKSLADKVDYGDASHDWEAARGETLRSLLMQWGEVSGWTVVWKLDRDYILEAGVVFRGTFTEVVSAIIRTFARAIPAPIGTFYKGNRVLVINTQEDDNA